MTETITKEKVDIDLPPPGGGVAIKALEPRQQAIQVTDPAHQMLSMIERFVLDPSVPIDRLDWLYDKRRTMVTEMREQAYDKAMALAQADMRPIAKDSDNTHTKSRYASYAALDNAIRPIYTKHGFGLSFDQGVIPTDLHYPPEDRMIRVLCRVSHEDGHAREHHIDIPGDGKGAKGGDVMTKTHATGSAFTYGQRYLLRMIFNIAVGSGADDDGNAAGGIIRVNEEQADHIKHRLVELGAKVERFLEFMKVQTIEEIAAKDYNKAMKALDDHQRAIQKMAERKGK